MVVCHSQSPAGQTLTASLLAVSMTNTVLQRGQATSSRETITIVWQRSQSRKPASLHSSLS